MPEATSGGGLQDRVRELERVGRFEADLRALVLSVTASLSSTLNLPASLARLCHTAAPLFGSRRAAAWMHDRRARELVLEASSDTTLPETTRIPLDVPDSPYVIALRHDQPQFVTIDAVRALTIPLRGRRRALGLLVLERLSDTGVSTPRILEGAAELGRQVSSAVENTLLFEDILRSRRELENTFNSLTDLVIVCDRRLRVTSANRAFRERFPATAGQLLDRPVAELVGPALAEWLAALKPTGHEEAREFDDPVLGGRFVVRVTPLTGADHAVHGLVVVAHDRTVQVQLESEGAVLRERLAQSEKLAALGQFVAGVAHELNNPLQGVLGHLELLRKTERVPPQLQRELRMVYREADRAARIINNLLVFAGKRRGARRRLNLNAVVTRTAALRSRIAKRGGIKIVRDLDPALPGIRGDATLLQQALLNIIINAEHAIAATGTERGTISLVTRGERDRTFVSLEIRDTGPGLVPDVLSRIFEPFFTTKDVGEGTGLGLALTYGIVQEHEGEITARNARGGGAVFRIVLPADTIKARRRRS